MEIVRFGRKAALRTRGATDSADAYGNFSRMDRPSEMSEVPSELIRTCVDEFAEMLDEELPAVVGDQWRLVATAFLARIGAVFESVAVLLEHEQKADAMIMVRVLYEHAATFCWLGIDPHANVGEWRDWDKSRRRALHHDAASFGIEILSEKELAEVDGARRPRSVAELADAIDRYWSQHFPAFRSHPQSGPKEIRSFRGMYAAIFRRGSRLAHATQDGLGRHVRVSEGELAVSSDEREPQPPDAPGFSVPMTAFVLLVYHHHFAWPGQPRVDQLNALLSD